MRKTILLIAVILLLAGLTLLTNVNNSTPTGAAISCEDEIASPASESVFEKFGSKVLSYDRHIKKYSEQYGVDPDLVRAVMIQESRGDPQAKSEANAYGLMQIVPKYHLYGSNPTCNACGAYTEADLYDPEMNICCGAKILSDNHKRSGSTKSYKCQGRYRFYSGWEYALREYNGWPCKGVPDPDYVEKVMEYYEAFSKCKGSIKRMSGSEGQVFSDPYAEGISYDIAPHFYHETGHDVNDYKTIVNNMRKMLDICSQEGVEITRCITEELTKYSDETLNYRLGGCDFGEKRIFYDIVELYDTCMNSMDTDCRCEHFFNTDKTKNKENYLIDDYIFSFKDDTMETSDLKVGFETPYVITGGDLDMEQSDLEVIFNYGSDGTFKGTELDIGGTGEGILAKIKDLITADPDMDHLRLYKNEDGEVAFVQEKYSSGSLYMEKKECTLSKKFYRFCVESDDEVLAYDGSVHKTDLYPVRYKYALFINDNPPQAITDVRAEDNMNAQETMILMWKKSAATDLAKYIIYYGEEFISLDMPIVASSIEITAADLTTLQPLSFNDYEGFPDSDFDTVKITKTLEIGSIYSLADHIIIVVPSADDTPLKLAVVGVDSNGNHILRLPDEAVVTGVSKDDLAPANPEFWLSESTIPGAVDIHWNSVMVNTDGTPRPENEPVFFSIYYLDSDFSKLEEATLFQVVGETANNLVTMTNLGAGEFYITVVAKDERGNLAPELIKRSISLS